MPTRESLYDPVLIGFCIQNVQHPQAAKVVGRGTMAVAKDGPARFLADVCELADTPANSVIK